ncbi:hypothetical protein Y032_0110g204 [Ancylostoma ceylanicum]|uniref:Uncharacterized protein n=1 Tax=Ancylostoma ceylanicum TaxID=53326 RepID=A0A016TET8_9BILA|nr:hypothetical protein Y032_0110g204 [Ancylostoma ceylanicum]
MVLSAWFFGRRWPWPLYDLERHAPRPRRSSMNPLRDNSVLDSQLVFLLVNIKCNGQLPGKPIFVVAAAIPS